MNNIWMKFRGVESTIAAAARYMLRRNLTPADVLAAYDEWMAARMAEMEKTEWRVESGVRSERQQAHSPHSTLHSQKNSTLKKRHKAGEYAILPRACPRCGGDVELYQMCPIESPVWRTQLACMADACAWHGKSRLPIDALLAAGAKNIKHNVTEG